MFLDYLDCRLTLGFFRLALAFDSIVSISLFVNS